MIAGQIISHGQHVKFPVQGLLKVTYIPIVRFEVTCGLNDYIEG